MKTLRYSNYLNLIPNSVKSGKLYCPPILKSKLTKFLFYPRVLNKLVKSKFYYYFAKFKERLFKLLLLLINFSNYSKQYLLTQIFLLYNYYNNILLKF